MNDESYFFVKQYMYFQQVSIMSLYLVIGKPSNYKSVSNAPADYCNQ